MSEYLLDQLRDIIAKAEESRYSMSKATGISESQLAQFVAGTKRLGHAAIDNLLDHLGYEIVVKKKRVNRKRA
ncbi:MAG: helix-turn-helix domain-containing protein [Planctomycetales bacterium]|nr:helix-turn-helix domain-containing protein [Planctomycetales bacterium]